METILLFIMRFILIILLILNNNKGFTQVSTDSVSYENDLVIYMTALEESHPNLYRFTPKKTFDSLFATVKANLSEKTTELDFFRSISKISSLIREGHSYVIPPLNLSSTIHQKKLFPLQVLVEDKQIIVRESRVEELSYLKGVTIESINGKSIQSILKTLEESTSSVSAFNNSRLISELSLYNNFALAYYYYIDSTSNFQIKYRSVSTGKSTSLEFNGSNNKLLKLKNYPELPQEPKPAFDLKIDEQNSLAIMKISTFAYWLVVKDRNEYLDFFEDSFTLLKDKGIENLIIDVRGNRGGEEMLAGRLLRYLIEDEFLMYKYCKVKTLDFNFTKSLPNSNKIMNLRKRNYIVTDSGYVMKKGDFLKSYAPMAKSNFEGNVFVLSDGMCSSACSTFLALIKTHNAGVIIGQESGGAFEDVDGRYYISFNLPFSSILVRYPLYSMKLNTFGGDNSRGVVPDYMIKPTIDEVTNCEDKEMDFVIKLIN